MEGVPHQLERGGTHGSRPLLSLASDERLTLEMRRGSQAAFEVAYRRYAAGMLALCRHILGSSDEAEEALQQSFAAAWSDLQRPDRPAPERLKPWLFTLARNRCLSILRSRRPSPVELEELPSTSGLAEQVARRADLRALLADLRDLPEEQRTALVLSEVSGMSHADIADVLGRKESGIKSLVFQARTTLGDWREAREAPCAEIRQQLSVMRGGALRRPVRRHLQACTSCQQFRAELQAQRRRLAIVLPVLPGFGLKRSVLAAIGLGGAGGGAAGGGAAVGAAAGGGAAVGAAAGVGAPALALFGSATVATMAVVGTLAGGGMMDIEEKRGRDRPPLLAQARDASAARERASQRNGSQPAGWRQRMPVRAQPPNLSDRASRPRSQPPGELPQSAAPAPTAGGAPATAEEPPPQEAPPTAPANTEASPPQEATAPTTAADRDAAEKIAKAEREAAEKIARADQEAAKKIAEADQEEARKIAAADQEEARKIAEADRKAAGKGPAEQRKAEEEKAKARQAAEEKRATARDEAAETRARALRDAEEKEAKALEELAKKRAEALAEAAKKNAAAAEMHEPEG